MSLFLFENSLLVVGNILAIGAECCCNGPPCEDPPCDDPYVLCCTEGNCSGPVRFSLCVNNGGTVLNTWQTGDPTCGDICFPCGPLVDETEIVDCCKDGFCTTATRLLCSSSDNPEVCDTPGIGGNAHPLNSYCASLSSQGQACCLSVSGAANKCECEYLAAQETSPIGLRGVYTPFFQLACCVATDTPGVYGCSDGPYDQCTCGGVGGIIEGTQSNQSCGESCDCGSVLVCPCLEDRYGCTTCDCDTFPCCSSYEANPGCCTSLAPVPCSGC